MKNEVETWVDMKIKYPEDRDEMSYERHKEFVEDCFKLYEQEGFNKTFWSPYSENMTYGGQSYKIIRRAPDDDGIFIEQLPMWLIQFADGKELFAFPEELIMSEMEFNGYQENI